MPEENKQRLKEYVNNYRKAKKLVYLPFFYCMVKIWNKKCIFFLILKMGIRRFD